jgi:transposase
VNKRLTAPILFDGTCNTAIFNMWLETELCPLLGANHVVVMDNAAFHKSQATRKLIEQTGATLLYLPPYSPELNPIEHTFGTMKRHRQYNENLSLDEIINLFF